MSGYSPNPLAKKLGLKDGTAGLLISVPDYLTEIGTYSGFASLETGYADGQRDRDYIHWFSVSRAELEHNLAAVYARLTTGGTLWIS